MREEVRVMAEYYAIGSISKSQLKEVCYDAVEFDSALKYSKKYGEKYDMHMRLLESYENSRISLEIIFVNMTSYDEFTNIINYGLTLWEERKPELYKDTLVEVWKLSNMFNVLGKDKFPNVVKAVKDGKKLKEIYKIGLSYCKIFL